MRGCKASMELELTSLAENLIGIDSTDVWVNTRKELPELHALRFNIGTLLVVISAPITQSVSFHKHCSSSGVTLQAEAIQWQLLLELGLDK